MRDLGICRQTGAVYEGSSSTCGFRVVPTPLQLPIRFHSGGNLKPIGNTSGFAAEIFREDSFDPVTKIRRGRVYTRSIFSSFESIWHVQDPSRQDLPVEDWAHNRAQCIALVNYQGDPLLNLRTVESKAHPPKVVLGWDEFITHWKIVSIESPIGGIPVLTLKAIFSLGEMPELVENHVPQAIRVSLIEAMEKVEGSTGRLAPVDVVDRCRDALSIVFGHLSGKPDHDLGHAVATYSKTAKNDELHLCAGKIVTRLHARGKPNEQHRRGLRPPSDEDAHLALRCLGIILVDLGWAR